MCRTDELAVEINIVVESKGLKLWDIDDGDVGKLLLDELTMTPQR